MSSMSEWTRRQFLGASAMAVAAQRKPNVLVVMSDQESALLPGPVEIPNRRKLAQSGVTFTAAFCNTPQCSAARSSLLTGLEPHHTGVITNVDESSLGKTLSPDLPNIGNVLGKAGYQTGYFGKWHLGAQAGGLSRFGFAASHAEGSDDEVAREAAAWISKQRGPWLAWVSFLNPHHIYEFPRELKQTRPRPGVRPPSTGRDNLAGKPGEQRQFLDEDQGKVTLGWSAEDWVRYRSFYCGLVEKVDANLGTVLAALPDPASTIIAYTSDHGDALGEHGLPFKGPFMYEDLIRIPLVLQAPGIFHDGGRRDDMVVQTDIAPTLASVCGVTWPSAVDGRDLTHKIAPRDAVFLEYYSKQKWVNPIRTIRTRRFKLNWYDRGNRELYDLTEDEHESRNLASDSKFAVLRKELEGRLNGWRAPLTT